MNYIVLDLEWNTPERGWKLVNEPFVFRNEIIQFGAVKVDENLNELDTYCQYVKPQYYYRINKHITELTDITTEMVSTGRDFKTVCQEFLDWCGEDYAFVTWSGTDKTVLEDNMAIHEMDESVLSVFYDAQIMFDDQITQADRNYALNYAMWKLDITDQAKLCHDALNDALNTVAVLRELDMSEGMEGYEVDWWPEDEEDEDED